MYPKPIQQLIDIFQKLPGIGVRQATRFAFFIFKERDSMAAEMIEALTALARVAHCPQCFSTIEAGNRVQCARCADPGRDATMIAVVEKESDMQNVERTGSFNGLYHILGGLIHPLDSNSARGLHLKELHGRVERILKEKKSCEVVLATSSTTEGDLTALYIERILSPLKDTWGGLKISRLGRGLSLGSEIEYADERTLKNAFANRK